MKTILVILSVVLLYAFVESYPTKIFMNSPMDVSSLDHFKIPSIQKSKITSRWISETFSISEKDSKIRDLILGSINSTPGPCPCPYLRYSSNKRRCGGNSSYSISGGKTAICYPVDVAELIDKL